VTKDQVVNQADPVVTAGWRSRGLSSLYPRGIPVGTVTSVGQVDTDLYKQVQVQPFVDFSSLSAVLVLTGERRP
jgi:rod shape-determining protein MreC